MTFGALPGLQEKHQTKGDGMNSGALARLAHFNARRRWWVIGVWIVLTLIGGVAAGKLSSRWFQSFSIPGRSAYEASQRTLHDFGVAVRPPNVVVFHTSGDATKSVAIKQAIAWTREHIADYGGDPSFIAITGGSAGGHLAALAALTAGDAEWQPGFEAADTSVQACVPFYGVYDLANTLGTRAGRDRLRFFLARTFFKSTDPAVAESATPLLKVGADAPPFFVIHGAHDSLVPVAEARAFVERLRAVSRQPVVYAELPGAQHAFDVFHSIRSAHSIRGVERFLRWVHAERGPAIGDEGNAVRDASPGRSSPAGPPAPATPSSVRTAASQRP